MEELLPPETAEPPQLAPRGLGPSRPDAMGQLSLNAEENNYRGNDPERECPLLRLSGDLPRLTP